MLTVKKTYFMFMLQICALVPTASAAPHPGSASSVLTSPEKGLYFERWGFRLGTQGTSWAFSDDLSRSSSQETSSWSLNQVAAGPATARAHVKKDELKVELSPETYAKRWIRDYGHLGLEILGTKGFNESGTRGVVIDILQRSKKIQLRQAVFLNGKQVVILTCSDQQEAFEKSLSDCNRLIKNFSWSTPKPQKAF